MMEMLTVAAVLAILMSVALPNIVSLQKSLNNMEANAKAKEIYIAIQNQLTSSQAKGTLSALTATIEGTSQKVTSAEYPDSYPDNWDNSNVYYLIQSTDNTKIKGDDIVGNYILTNATASASQGITDGAYIVEMQPDTAEVYCVYYCSFKNSNLSQFNFSNVSTLTWNDLKTRNIGYYGGKKLATLTSDDFSLKNLTVTAVNSEELYVSIYDEDFVTGGDTQKASFDSTKLKVSVKVTDTSRYTTDENGEKQYTYYKQTERTGDSLFSGSNSEQDIILDSMRPGLSFNECVNAWETGNGTITPGDDITIDVTCSYGDSNDTAPVSISKATNSLFGDDPLVTDSTGKSVSDTNSIGISAVRHLNNLRSSKYDYTQTNDKYKYEIRYDQQIASLYCDIVQTADIDFADSSFYGSSIGTKADGTRVFVPGTISLESALEAPGNPLDTFTPISNSFLFGDADSSGWVNPDYHGQNLLIENFIIKGTDNTGLFGVYKGYLADLNMTDPIVDGTNNTGALIGLFSTYGSVSNCGVYLTKKDSSGNIRVKNPNVTSDDDDIGSITGTGDNIGGLIGNIDNDKVSGSFAAIPVSGNNYVGGFAGGVYSGDGVSNCYSSGPVAATSSFVGGFTGILESSASSCFSTSNVYGDSFAGGFAGYAAGWQENECTAYGRVTKRDGTLDTDTSGGFSGNYANMDTDNRYLKMNGYNDTFISSPISWSGPTGATLGELKHVVLSENDSHYYSVRLKGQIFPFAPTTRTDASGAISNMPYYGDWPTALTAKWVRHEQDFKAEPGTADTVYQTVDTIYGAVPTYTPSDANAMDLLANRNGNGIQCYYWWTGWQIGDGTISTSSPITQDTTYTATFKEFPSPLLLLNTTAGVPGLTTSITVDGITCKSLWTDYISLRPKDNDGKLKTDTRVDSEAPLYASISKANCATAVNSYLTNNGFTPDADNTNKKPFITTAYPTLYTGTASKTSGNYSWLFSIKKGVYAQTISSSKIQGTTGGANPSTASYTNKFVVIFGDKIDNSNSYDVVVYDVGRASMGQSAYCKKTTSAGTPATGYYGYNIPDTTGSDTTWYKPSTL